MNVALAAVLSLFSVLVPQKTWFAPAQPLNVTVKSDKDVTLVLTDFAGKPVAPKGSADAAAGATVDVKAVFPTAATPGTYVLYAVAKTAAAPAAAPKDFFGTPLVIQVLKDSKAGLDDAMVIHVQPLRFVKMTTDAGEMTMIFYYDVAPHTVDSFLDLTSGGYFDGLTFHRIIPSFVIQGGDPTGTGRGGPGYHLDAEFNDRPHNPGTLSMARSGSPNSGGSQFFICLDYSRTQALDGKYTALGKVVEGFDTTVTKIAAAKLTDPQAGAPETPPVIQKAEVLPVTADKNPYAAYFAGDANPANPANPKP